MDGTMTVDTRLFAFYTWFAAVAGGVLALVLSHAYLDVSYTLSRAIGVAVAMAIMWPRIRTHGAGAARYAAVVALTVILFVVLSTVSERLNAHMQDWLTAGSCLIVVATALYYWQQRRAVN